MLVQDVTSRPYRTMIEGFLDVFAREGPPLVLAGGHDHSLQVLVDTIADGREYIQLVSGSGSRMTRIRATHAMKWGRSSPGYMRLTFLRDGSVQLDVVVGSVTHLACPGPDPGTAASCMAAGADSIHTGYSRRLR
jgi:hypothetical protein